MGSGGTDADFWQDRAGRLQANGRHSGPPGEPDRERLAAAERYERLYSAAARMLSAQGPAATWQHWPEVRRQRWHELEKLLAALPSNDVPGTADPAWQLASRLDATGRPISIPDAIRDWDRRLGQAPPEADAGEFVAVVMPSSLYLTIIDLLGELVHRLAPGRPVGAVGDTGADLSKVSHELAVQLLNAVTGEPSAANPVRARPELRAPQPLSAGLSLPMVADRLATAARLAAEATPTPRELAATRDFSVRHDAVVAAADLLAGLRRPAGPGWQERHDGIRPDIHWLAGYRWDTPAGRPLGLAERAAEIRTTTQDLRPPWRVGPADPLPESTPGSSWMALSYGSTLVTAELLDELAARLLPGRWIGTIRFAALPMRNFVHGRLRLAAAET